MPGENLRAMLDKDPSYLPSPFSHEWGGIEDELRDVSKGWIESFSGRFDPSMLKSGKSERDVYAELGDELIRYVGIDEKVKSSMTEFAGRMRVLGMCTAFVIAELQDRALLQAWYQGAGNFPLCDEHGFVTEPDKNAILKIAFLEGITRYFINGIERGNLSDYCHR